MRYCHLPSLHCESSILADSSLMSKCVGVEGVTFSVRRPGLTGLQHECEMITIFGYGVAVQVYM